MHEGHLGPEGFLTLKATAVLRPARVRLREQDGHDATRRDKRPRGNEHEYRHHPWSNVVIGNISP
eukprot:scaffold201812_cov29-Prasinocladus_malaysianus.AAC.1